MKVILKIVFLFFVWFTNQLNATPTFAKVVLPNYELTFSKTENVKGEGVIKIGSQNFARSVILENSFYQKTTAKLYKDNNLTTPYDVVQAPNDPVIVNYVYNSSGEIQNSYLYDNVIYYNNEWINNKWVRNIAGASSLISLYNKDEFSVRNVFTVQRYTRDNKIIAEKIYNYAGDRMEPTKLLATSNQLLGITEQGAEFLSEYIRTTISPQQLFGTDEGLLVTQIGKVANGFNVNVYHGRQGYDETIPSNLFNELSITIPFSASRSQILEILAMYGLTENEYSYDFFLFKQDAKDTWSRYGNWLDNSLTTPPLMVTLLADIVMGVPGAIYGFATSTHWRTGATLSGWDHALNVLEIIPTAGVFIKVGKGSVTGLKVYNKISGVAFDVFKLAKTIPPLILAKTKNLAQHGMRLATDAADHAYIVVNNLNPLNTGRLAKVNNQGMEILHTKSNITGEVLIDFGPTMIKQGNSFVSKTVDIVKDVNGEIWVRVVNGSGNWLTQRTNFWDDWINKCFPSKNWSNTTFVTKGKNYSTFKTTNASIYNDMKALNPNEIKLQEFIEAGSTVPVKVLINNGDEFFKIVPKGNNIGSPSAYYVDQAQLNLIKTNPEKLEQVLGLPLGSVNAEYDVFKITYQGSSGYVFKSTVAGTEQFANATTTLKYLTPGGGTQTLILDNMDGAKWLKGSAPIESIAPNKLPLIGN
jgi:hypothetical protein